MENLNAEQIKKALECCPNRSCGVDCPYYDAEICTLEVMRDALALINSQEQRIKELAEENERLRQSCSYLKPIRGFTEEELDRVGKESVVVADTVRKVQERLKKKMLDNIEGRKFILLYEDELDEIAKEIIEGGDTIE